MDRSLTNKLPISARLFGADVRSLAAFRIAAGLVLLADLALRAQYLTAFYTDQGILPRFARIFLFEDVDPSGMRHAWSLHMLSGEWWAQAVLLLVAAMFAFWLLIGYRTRLATCASWLLIVSLDSRNPMLMDSGDALFRSLLFWAMFVPLGCHWSVDAYRSQTPSNQPIQLVTLGTFALIMQVCTMYWFSVCFKTNPVWLQDLSGVYYSLSNDIFATPLGHSMLAYPRLLEAMTMATYLLELLGPAVIFCPLATSKLRMLAVASFWALHAGLGLTLAIGLFAVICMIAWIPVLPGEFWDWWMPQVPRVKERLASHSSPRALRMLCQFLDSPERPRLRLHLISKAIITAMLVYMLLWNTRELNPEYWESRILPRSWNSLARITGLDQRWSMFAPLPSTDDGWYVMQGTLRNGQIVNLWQPDQPLPWKKPAKVSATYVCQRWRKYLDTLKQDGSSNAREYFVHWLRNRWNQQQARGDRQLEVTSVEIVFQLEETPKPGAGDFEPIRIELWKWEYE